MAHLYSIIFIADRPNIGYVSEIKKFKKGEKMRKSVLSLAAMVLLGTVAYAGGDIAPVEEVAVPVVADNSAFYIGLGFGQGYVNDDQTDEEMKAATLMLQAGYQFNEYIALEGRYTFGLSMDYDPGLTGNGPDDYDGDFSSWGIYVKPMYPIGDLSIYALLGYGGVMLDDLEGGDAYESGFQWGLGAQYAFTENIVGFVDYVKLYDDTGFDYRAQTEDVDSDTWTIGVSYKF